MKKRQIFYVDEEFIRRFGMANKSQIVNEALKKYYAGEKENYKRWAKKISIRLRNLRVVLYAISTNLALF